MPGPLIAVIPARGGSKRLPGKNGLSIGGRTLVQRAVDCALQVDGVDRVFVDTDSPELRLQGIDAGAEVPYLRPASLADDVSRTADSLLYLLDHLLSVEQYEPTAVVLLQPTSPLRTAADVLKGIEVWRNSPEVPVASICMPVQPLGDMLTRCGRGPWVRALEAGPDAEFAFEDGSVYVTPVAYLRSWGEVFRPVDGATYWVSPLHGIDVDEFFQFQIAQALYEADDSRS